MSSKSSVIHYVWNHQYFGENCIKLTFLGPSGGMTLCLHDRLCVCLSVCLCVCVSAFWYTLFFSSVYIFLIQQLIRFIFWHALYLRTRLITVLMFLVMLPSLIMLIYAKSVSPVNILVYTFLHFGIHFFISLYLFNDSNWSGLFLACMYLRTRLIQS